MRFYFTVWCLAFLLAYALRRGGQPERFVALTFALSFIVGFVALSVWGSPDLLAFDAMHFAIELACLAVLLFTAVYANRWWPICIAALQVIVIFTHLVKASGVTGMVGVYWAMTTIPTYMQYIALALGTALHARRVGRVGPYRSWRKTGPRILLVMEQRHGADRRATQRHSSTAS